MAAKFVVFNLLLASAYGSGGYSSFSYGVSDPNTGDIKDQHEKRDGDNVVGKYSLLESDGTKRIVEYEANAKTGFNAIVRKEPAAGFAGAALSNGPLGHQAHGAYAHPAPVAPVPPIGYPGAISHPGAYSGAYNPHGSQLAGAYPGANGYNNLNGPQGVPTVSHFSHSVVHEIPRPYAGSYAGAYNGAYGGAYGGPSAHGFAGPLGHGYAGAHGHSGLQGLAGAHGLGGAYGIAGANGLAHSYNTLTRGEAYPHGYGGYGAQRNGAAYGAGLAGGYGAAAGGYGAGFGSGLSW